MIKQVCVYCASSTQIANSYKKEAFELGKILASNNIHCIYGGGSVGLMGKLSEAIIKYNGNITGIIPQFMVDEGWNNEKVKQIVVQTMHERKRLMIENADAAIALPGGCGTFEELLEVITWKQLGIFIKPIIILNINHYFDPLLNMLDKAIEERFMRNEHRQIWSVAEHADEILKAIEDAPVWKKDAIGIAAL